MKKYSFKKLIALALLDCLEKKEFEMYRQTIIVFMHNISDAEWDKLHDITSNIFVWKYPKDDIIKMATKALEDYVYEKI